MDYPCSPPAPSNDELARHRVVTRSLAERNDYLLIGMSLLGGGLLCGAICFPHRLGWTVRVELGEHASLFALPLAVVPLMLTLILISAVLTPWRRGLELAWLAALPFPFAHRGYLTVLRRESGANDLKLLLTFDHEPAPRDVETLCTLALPSSKLIWQDERCVLVRSPPGLETKELRGNFGGIYTNGKLHRWFRRVAAPFLIKLHQSGGLKKVELRV